MKTEEKLELEDLENKDNLIVSIHSICNANKLNKHCSVYQLKTMIDEEFKLYGYD